jgi:hypothetical protein
METVKGFAYLAALLTVVFFALAWPDAQAKQPRDSERIADALERLANCSCMQVCDRWHCDASSSSSNGGELP